MLSNRPGQTGDDLQIGSMGLVDHPAPPHDHTIGSETAPAPSPDILTQINAVRAALHQVEEHVLRGHVSHFVAGAFASGDVVEQRQRVEELIETVGRMTR